MTRHSVLIDRLGHLGDGVAEGPIFAPGTLPGEAVSGELDGSKLRDIRIETPSEHRVKPHCRHAKACGGCQLQHVSDAFVADWKRDVILQALSAHGLDAELRKTLTSPGQSRRRATLSARRTKKGALVGFHARESDVIVEIPECQVVLPEIALAAAMASDLCRVGASRKGELSLTVTASTGGLDVAVAGGKPVDGQMRVELAHVAEVHDLARLTWDDDVIVTRHPPYQSFGDVLVVPPPGAFLQATHHGESALVGAVQEAVVGAKRIVDLFSGCGTFSLPLAHQAQVHAVEAAPDMVQAMDAGWRKATGLKQVTGEARDLFRRPLMPDELAGFDAAVIDPPRAGAEAQVAEICQSAVPRLAYVSCNPVTFARDAVALVDAGFVLNWVQPVDQFRWSSHVELAAEFTHA